MAQQWYIQHGNKRYGPLAAAKLKSLASEGRITPTTSVRLGESGKWVPAARVQGLFGASSGASTTASTAAAAPPPSAPSESSGLDAPPVAPPAPPPLASPVARVPLGSVAAASRDAPDGPIAPKITGAVALVFGILALATFWLPMLSVPMGWTGIVVGGLGLLLGASGMALSAMQKGAGLYLNVAGTSSAAVGLVLSIVLGVTFGMFTSGPAPKPQPRIVARPPQLPAEPPPPVEMPPAEEPQPEAPPEVVWTDAGEAIEQGPIKATIAAVAIHKIRLESMDLSTLKAAKSQPMLKIKVAIENTTQDKIVEVPGWTGGGSVLGGELGGLLQGSELGKTVQSATATALLTDNAGNDYKQTPAVRVMGAQVAFGADSALRPGEESEKDLVFPLPLESIEYLRLELPPAGFGGSEPLRFQIPRSMIEGL